MEQEQLDFYRKIRRQITAYLDKHQFKYGDILLLAPDFFHLLVKLSLDERVPGDKKIKLAGAIGYFILPIDLLPEIIFGPLGYMDDIAIAAYVLNDFINHNDIDIVHDHWAGEGDVLASVQNVLTLADNFLGEGLFKRIKRRIKEFEQGRK
jgi:uncharacterized membrane protein YkvA (DUF1232 family)